jgi:hypothetical protein
MCSDLSNTHNDPCFQSIAPRLAADQPGGAPSLRSKPQPRPPQKQAQPGSPHSKQRTLMPRALPAALSLASTPPYRLSAERGMLLRRPRPPQKQAQARFTPQQAAYPHARCGSCGFIPGFHSAVPSQCRNGNAAPAPSTPKASPSQVHPTASSVVSCHVRFLQLYPWLPLLRTVSVPKREAHLNKSPSSASSLANW